MSALGLMIMIVAGAVTLDVVLENTRNTDASVVGQTVSNVDLGGFLVAGVLLGVAFMLGLMLLLAGLRRANRKRLERKELTRSYEGTAAHAETLQEERDRLAAELEQERMARTQTAPEGRRTAAEPVAAQGLPGEDPSRTRTSQRVDPAMTDDGTSGGTHAPVYPNEQVHPNSPATAPGSGTATAEHAKPTIKDRLLGR